MQLISKGRYCSSCIDRVHGNQYSVSAVAHSYHVGFSASARCMSSLGGQATQVFHLYLMSVTLMAPTDFALMVVPWVDFLELRFLQQVRTV